MEYTITPPRIHAIKAVKVESPEPEETRNKVTSPTPQKSTTLNSLQEVQTKYKSIEEAAAMDDLLSDGIPPIDGRPPYIVVGCDVDTLVSLNLAAPSSLSQNVKRNKTVTMMGKYVNSQHKTIFKKAMPFIRDHNKVPNKVLMGLFSVPGGFEWLMCRYKILDRPRYQIGLTVDILDDNYWAALAASES